MTPFICAGCQDPIMERFLMKVLDKSWHVSCVKCSDCQCPLSEKCFSRENKLYCRSDFFKHFGTRCAACNVGLCPEDLVRRAANKVYHIQCFTCSICKRQLNTGEQLYLVQGGEKFLCDSCYPAPAPMGVQTLGTQSALADSSSAAKMEMRRRMSDADQLPASGMGSAAVAATTAATIMTTGSPHPQTPAMDSRKGKTRTSINPRQLEILQAAYERDSKPSRAAREEMASQTGLTMKVIQVWFQNRRSKDKKDGVLKEDSISAASPAATPGQNVSSIGTPMGIGSAVPENGVAMLHQAMQRTGQ